MRERRDSERSAAERSPDLRLVKTPLDSASGQFENALRGARVYVLSQDRDLRPTAVYSPRGEQMPAFPDSAEILALKRRVLETGQPDDAEAVYMMPEGPVLFSLHIDPTFGSDNTLNGIMCAAIEVTRIRSLESEQQRLTEELGRTLQRYETALRGSKVTVFTQDRELRYTSISNPFLSREAKDIIGRTDEEIIPAENRAAIAALKTTALESGLPKGGEIRIAEGSSIRWYDLHVEPQRDVAGTIVGLTCAAVDVTERKEGEAHLRLLMRELTHRSKNLLAVIQAMARQTARHVGTIDGFLDQFSARLQALARSHDLLVQEEWHGVSLAELARSQLAPYLDRSGSQIRMEGPQITLRPEAAQNLGLALHELAINAVKFGALSTPAGRVAVTWAWQPQREPPAVEMLWVESNGPTVATPVQRGFGTLVVERNLARSLEADVELTFATEGVRARITIPACPPAAADPWRELRNFRFHPTLAHHPQFAEMRCTSFDLGCAAAMSGATRAVVSMNEGHPAMARGRKGWRRSMHSLATMTGGFVATLGLISLAISGPTLFPSPSSAAIAPASDTTQMVNRSGKGDRLPIMTVGQNRPAAPKAPVRTLKENNGQRMEGCDPLVSPLAGSSLSQVAGRCIVAVETRERVAMIGRGIVAA